MTIGVAIIGSGIFAKESHLPAVLATPTLSLKAIYSRTHASASSLASEIPKDDQQSQDSEGKSKSKSPVDLYSSDSSEAGHELSDLLQRPDIQACIIALPITAQPDYIKQALAAGKHVLAEKPIAKDVATARELLQWISANVNSNTEEPQITFSVAENFRYMERFRYAGEEVQRLGKVLGFRQRLSALVQPGAKYYETSWRKTPEYQGGFLLDGGVHFIAGMRLMLGHEARMERLSAYTAQLQPHLPPIDTVDASVRLANGSTGVFAISFGTTFTGAEWIVACEKGTVDVDRERVTVIENGKEDSKDFPDDGNGVKQEVKAWAESIVNGKQEPLQKPEEALADLEILEAMVKSGESDGKPIQLALQI